MIYLVHIDYYMSAHDGVWFGYPSLNTTIYENEEHRQLTNG